jgi:hypothetical protein
LSKYIPLIISILLGIEQVVEYALSKPTDKQRAAQMCKIALLFTMIGYALSSV